MTKQNLSVFFNTGIRPKKQHLLLMEVLMINGVKKANLPFKICTKCKRPFSWRKKWEKIWNEVKCCSKKCRNK